MFLISQSSYASVLHSEERAKRLPAKWARLLAFMNHIPSYWLFILNIVWKVWQISLVWGLKQDFLSCSIISLMIMLTAEENRELVSIDVNYVN